MSLALAGALLEGISDARAAVDKVDENVMVEAKVVVAQMVEAKIVVDKVPEARVVVDKWVEAKVVVDKVVVDEVGAELVWSHPHQAL